MSKSNFNDGDFECIHSEESYNNTPESQEITREEPGNNIIATAENRATDMENNPDTISAEVSSNAEPTWGISSMLSSFWLGRQYKVNIPTQQINNSPVHFQLREDFTEQSDVSSENELVENNLRDDNEIYTDSEEEEEECECLAYRECLVDADGEKLEESTGVASDNVLVENNLDNSTDHPDDASENELVETNNSTEKVKDKEEDCFVIIANSEPVCYMRNIESARIKMRELACMLSRGYMDHNIYIEQQSLDEIHVIGNYRYYILSHSRILERICVHKVDRFTDDSCILNTVRNLLSYSPGIW